MKKMNRFLVLACVAFASPGCKSQVQDWTRGVLFDRHIVFVLENTNYNDAMHDPYLRSVAYNGALLANFHGNFHPSYANYLAMVGGDYFWTFLDFQKNIDAPSIADLLEARGFTWKNYAEGYPGHCFLGSTQGRFARKHVPFLSFKPIQEVPARCANVVDAAEFKADYAAGKLPNYSFYSPNLDDDGHDTNLPTASAWLKGMLDPLLADTEFMKRTLIEITFDESKTYLSNHIYTVFVGGMVNAGYVDQTRYNHYNVLRTVEENFGVGTLGAHDETAVPLLNIWTPEAKETIRAVLATQR